jgi:hypothetical protein
MEQRHIKNALNSIPLPIKRKIFKMGLYLQQEGKIYFGLHVSDRALVTCLVGSQAVHLVDAADGGYALAAKQIKQQILEE